ncbi:Chitin synthase, class 1 [Rhizoclosmatium sp. JEL0117]|nr:Chitin synthase, class 1 [Rhizoclosmatium sp. JEL0117]
MSLQPPPPPNQNSPRPSDPLISCRVVETQTTRQTSSSTLNSLAPELPPGSFSVPPPQTQSQSQQLYTPLLAGSSAASSYGYPQFPPPPLAPQQQQHPYQQQQTQPQPQQSSFGTFPDRSQVIDVLSLGRSIGLGFGTQSQSSDQYPPPQIPSLLRRPTKYVTKEVVLTDGEFILDVPLSKDYSSVVRYSDAEEFTHLRYSAITTQPDEFSTVFSLRQTHMRRYTKIAVVCTMYNEDDQLFTKTMSAVMDNIAYLCSLRGRKGWDANSWRDIVVCIVSDGMGVKPCNPRTLDVLAAMGCYMEGLPRSHVNGKEVKAHMFEFTTQVRVNPRLEAEFTSPKDDKIVPMQTIFLLKEKNAKKINSHRWFFNGICQVLQPEVAGACGEIAAELGPWWKNLVNPLVAVQNFEYKMSNILDKPLESVFGYISVLPGAFSAYRYSALQGKPLESYFKGEALHAGHDVGRPNVSQSNMYLAEDRILCFELVMKREERFILKYVKSAKAETDVPTEFPDLIKQRRRWFNGSFFASVIFTSGHSVFRKLMLVFETFYNGVNLVYSWFSISSMYICFYFMFNIVSSKEMSICTNAVVDNALSDPFYPYGGAVSAVLRGSYIAAFITMVVASLGNNPSTIKTLLILISAVFAICMAFMLALIIFTVYSNIRAIPGTVTDVKGFLEYIPSNPNFADLVLSLLCTYVLYIVSSLMFLDPWHPFTCLLQYLLMTPSFSNMLMVYAFCNIHDISWGTKGQDSVSSAPAVQSSKNEKGKQVATTNVPAPDYSNELNKLKDMANEMAQPQKRMDVTVQKSSDGDVSTSVLNILLIEYNVDHFKAYRTYVLMWWFISNFALTYILTDDFIIRAMSTPGRANPFLVFLLWSVTGLTGIRFLGCFVYWVQWILESAGDVV